MKKENLNKARTANSTYPQVAVQWLNQALCFYQSFCLVDSEVLRNRHLLVAAKRWPQLFLMMKRVFIIFTFLLTETNIFCQDLALGKYCREAEGILFNIKESNECLSFETKEDFYYSVDTDFDRCFGQGKYTLKNDTLLLSFAAEKIKPKTIFDIHDFQSNTDSIYIDVKLMDTDGDLISFANVYCTNAENDNNNYLGAATTNFDGECRILIKNNFDNFWLHIRYVGFEPSSIHLKKNFNYSIVGHLSPVDFGKGIYNEKWMFHFKSMNDNKFFLVNLMTKKSSIYYLYSEK